MLTTVVAGRVYDYNRCVGATAYTPFPYSVALGADDTLYVLSRQYEQGLDVAWNKTATLSQINKLTIGAVPGDEEFIGTFSKYGDDDGELIWPVGLALDSEENIYVTDEWLNRVSIFDKEGNFLSLWGTSGNGQGKFNGPSGIAADRDFNFYIVDSRNHRVQKFTKDGEFLFKWGSFGEGRGEFNAPWGITLDAHGDVFVADHRNHRVQKFSPDGKFLKNYGQYGTGVGQLNLPSDVAVDPDGDVYVSDWANNRVQIFEPDGRFIVSLVGDAQQLAKWQQAQVDSNADIMKARRRVHSTEPEWRFAKPVGLTFDSQKGRLIVADTQRGRLQIYDKPKDYMEPQFNL